MAPIQRLAAEAIWAWFDELWEGEHVDSGRLQDLADEVLPVLDSIERSSGHEQDDAIVELAERLRWRSTSRSSSSANAETAIPRACRQATQARCDPAESLRRSDLDLAAIFA